MSTEKIIAMKHVVTKGRTHEVVATEHVGAFSSRRSSCVWMHVTVNGVLVKEISYNRRKTDKVAREAFRQEWGDRVRNDAQGFIDQLPGAIKAQLEAIEHREEYEREAIKEAKQALVEYAEERKRLLAALKKAQS